MYKELMAKSDLCWQKSLECRQAGDFNLCDFYARAAIGFEIKAKRLIIGEEIV